LEIVYFDQNVAPVKKPTVKTRTADQGVRPQVEVEMSGLLSRFWKRCHPLRLIRR
jgi:hypothetical protein